MEKGYLLDTNILIYFLNDQIPEDAYQTVKDMIKQSFNISIITKLELLGWNKYTEDDFAATKIFLSNASVININDNIVDATIDVMRKNKLDLADAIIAVTAMNNNLTLVTRNTKDFNKVDSLDIYNPFNI
ncbi:MAG: type II toxin-antitoxin system VapC family toxin [Cyanobacteriota bacterium]